MPAAKTLLDPRSFSWAKKLLICMMRTAPQIDATGIRLLDFAALSCVAGVVEDAQRHGVAVVFAGCSQRLKASLKACGL